MAFGQQAGPPATARQVRELVDLVVAAGHVDLRDARHVARAHPAPGGGQVHPRRGPGPDRPAARGRGPGRDRRGRRLGAARCEVEPPVPAAVRQKAAAADRRAAAQARDLRSVPAEALAAELQRRGWAVVQP